MNLNLVHSIQKQRYNNATEQKKLKMEMELKC